MLTSEVTFLNVMRSADWWQALSRMPGQIGSLGGLLVLVLGIGGLVLFISALSRKDTFFRSHCCIGFVALLLPFAFLVKGLIVINAMAAMNDAAINPGEFRIGATEAAALIQLGAVIFVCNILFLLMEVANKQRLVKTGHSPSTLAMTV